MDSLWFVVDDEVDYDVDNSTSEESQGYMGVFNQKPEEIASWLQRPKTPFVPSSFNNSGFENSFFDNRSSSMIGSQSESFNSYNRFSNKAKFSEVSVF